MVLQLHGTLLSTATQRVAVVLKEKHVPYKIALVRMENGEHKSEEHLKRQPFGQVPYIDDDGFILFESRAIARYISTVYHDQGTPLLPSATDFKATALFEQAVSKETSDWNTLAGGISIERVLNP